MKKKSQFFSLPLTFFCSLSLSLSPLLLLLLSLILFFPSSSHSLSFFYSYFHSHSPSLFPVPTYSLSLSLNHSPPPSPGCVCNFWEVSEDSAPRLCSYGFSAERDVGSDVQHHPSSLGAGPDTSGTHFIHTDSMNHFSRLQSHQSRQSPVKSLNPPGCCYSYMHRRHLGRRCVLHLVTVC